MNSPVLSQKKLRQLIGPDMYGDVYEFVSLNVDETLTLPEALDRICAETEDAVRRGKLIVMLSVGVGQRLGDIDVGGQDGLHDVV